MRRLGEVVRIAAGRLIVRSPDDSRPSVGEDALNADLEVVGEVVDIFGPVDRPFVTLVPASDPDPALIGTRVYVR